MGKINNPAVFNWQPVFNEMAMGCDVTVPVSTVDDFRLLLNACFEELNPAHYTIGIMFLGRSTPTSVRPRYLSKRKTNPIQSNPPVKLLMLQLWQKQSC